MCLHAAQVIPERCARVMEYNCRGDHNGEKVDAELAQFHTAEHAKHDHIGGAAHETCNVNTAPKRYKERGQQDGRVAQQQRAFSHGCRAPECQKQNRQAGKYDGRKERQENDLCL